MEKLTLIFQNSRGKERTIANNLETIKDCFDAINKFLQEHNYKSSYTRIWEEDERLKLDVGSHTEFFYIEGIDFNTYLKETRKDDVDEEKN